MVRYSWLSVERIGVSVLSPTVAQAVAATNVPQAMIVPRCRVISRVKGPSGVPNPESGCTEGVNFAERVYAACRAAHSLVCTCVVTLHIPPDGIFCQGTFVVPVSIDVDVQIWH